MESHKSKTPPLSSVRIINLGTQWASRVTAMLLADQGAEVIEIIKPDRCPHAVDYLLDRGKRLIKLDLGVAENLTDVFDCAADADVVIENMRSGTVSSLGLDFTSLNAKERGIVYVSMPGFAKGDPLAEAAAWEGTINASTGVYTNISPLGPLLGGDPIYSAVPMASAYGGVLGALAVSLGLYGRQTRGNLGQFFEVPLADAVMSAMALLICEMEGQPSRYNFPAIDNSILESIFPILRDLREHMTEDHVGKISDFVRSHGNPTINFYDCSDERVLFVCAPDHISQNRAFLQTLGIYDKVIAEGMISESPHSEGSAGNNINKGGSLSLPWRRRLMFLIAEAVKTKTAKEWESLLRDVNVPASMVQTTAEWLSDPTLLSTGVTADLEDPEHGTIRQPGRFLSIEGENIKSPELRGRFKFTHDLRWLSPPIQRATVNLDRGKGLLDGIKVLDFSNIIAGPATGRTLAEHGADVIRVDPPAPQAGPFATMWFGVDVNQGKRALVLDLKTKKGQKILSRLLEKTDVVLHNFLDRSARAMGIAHDQLVRVKPEIISCQIGAWTGPKAGAYDGDPSFDPVLQAASGIMARYGTRDKPVLHALASCVDYNTGFNAAMGIVQALLARSLGFGGSYVRTSLAMAAQLVQFPHMVLINDCDFGQEPSGQFATGESAEQHLYQLADGWVYLGCRTADGALLAKSIGALQATSDSIADAIRHLKLSDVNERISNISGASAVRVKTLASIRADRTLENTDHTSNWMNTGSFRLYKGAHPSGYQTTLPLPTWIRPDDSRVQHLSAAPLPGSHSLEILSGLGFSEREIQEFLDERIVDTSWQVSPRYLPL